MEEKHLVGGSWYWIQKEEIDGGYSRRTPAEYNEPTRSFYSANFSGIPVSQCIVGREVVPVYEELDNLRQALVNHGKEAAKMQSELMRKGRQVEELAESRGKDREYMAQFIQDFAHAIGFPAAEALAVRFGVKVEILESQVLI